MVMGIMPLLADVLIDGNGLALLGAGIGAGLVIMGAAKAIGHLAGCAVESQARQPEAGGRIFTSMIIAAALIEGVTFFALVICMMIGGQLVSALQAVSTATGH